MDRKLDEKGKKSWEATMLRAAHSLSESDSKFKVAALMVIRLAGDADAESLEILRETLRKKSSTSRVGTGMCPFRATKAALELVDLGEARFEAPWLATTDASAKRGVESDIVEKARRALGSKVLSASAISETLGLSVPAVRMALDVLVEDGFADKVPRGNWSGYRLKRGS